MRCFRYLYRWDWVLPGFVETHIHWDKSCILDRCASKRGDLEEAIEELEDEIVELNTRSALMENEMRTIMSDHMGINKALEDMGKSGYGDKRQYGDYD